MKIVHEFGAFDRPRLLKVRQAQALLNIGNTKFYDLVKTGQLELVKVGRGSFVKTDAIDRFVDSLTSQPAL